MEAMRTLAVWNDAMSDGCSVPSWLRWLIPLEFAAACAACVRHDEVYYYGGSRAHRALADHNLRIGLIAAGMSGWRARMYWIGVRLGGRPMFRVPNVSWAFGGGRFRYDDEPAWNA